LIKSCSSRKKDEKKPESANPGFYSGAATQQKQGTVPSEECAFIVAAPADFFNQKKHKFAWKG